MAGAAVRDGVRALLINSSKYADKEKKKQRRRAAKQQDHSRVALSWTLSNSGHIVYFSNGGILSQSRRP